MVLPLLRWAGVDRPVAFGIFSKVFDAVAGAVTLLLIAFRFSPQVQGYYYTFISLLALRSFVELGLSTVIVTFASHEWSRLSLDDQGAIAGSPSALSRLLGLGRLTIGWYAFASVVFAASIGIGGHAFLSHSAHSGVNWAGPWIVLCPLAGFEMCLAPVLALLEGCNQLSQVYGFRFVQNVVQTVILWAAIALGAGLWALAAYMAVTILTACIFLARRYRGFLLSFLSRPAGHTISWRAEMLPMQWRMGLSSLSGYFIFWLFTPVLFRYHGAVVAGQMGMTWAVVRTVSALATSWEQPKAARYGVLISSKDYVSLDHLLYSTLRQSVVVVCATGLAMWSVIYVLYAFHCRLAVRLLPPLPAGLFIIGTIFMQFSHPLAAYLRAHKKEPFLGLSIGTGLLVALSDWVLGRRFGPIGMGAGYAAVVGLVTVPWSVCVWRRCRKAWHGEAG